MSTTRAAGFVTVALWGTDALLLMLDSYWSLAAPVPFAGRVWIAACSILVGLLVLLCATRLIGAAPVAAFTGALAATTLCGWLSLSLSGKAVMPAFAAGVVAVLALRRLRAGRAAGSSRRQLDAPDAAP